MLKKLSAFVEWSATALMALIFVIFVIAVAMRYLAHAPLTWTDELTVILFSWMIFWASGPGMAPREQMRFEVLYDMLPQRLARAVFIIGNIAFGLIFLAAVWPSADYALFMARQRTPVLEIPFVYVYACFPLFLLTMALRLLLSAGKVMLGTEEPA